MKTRKFQVEIICDEEEDENDPRPQIAEMLRCLAYDVENNGSPYVIRNNDKNTIGFAGFLYEPLTVRFGAVLPKNPAPLRPIRFPAK